MFFKTPFSIIKSILALGGDSEGVFAFYKKGGISLSENFGDLLEEKNFQNYKEAVENLFKKESVRLILTDLHPLYNSAIFGAELAKRLKIPNIKIQHHLAHIFSAFGEEILQKGVTSKKFEFLGLATDGTGYGEDGKIWGGEVFKIKNKKSKIKIDRVGYLENQVLIGGELAIREPARMLIAILIKFLEKEKIYPYVRKYYSKNQFEVLLKQLKEKFNCVETSSTARILDAVSVLLGFCQNRRDFKHQPVFLLEKNSRASPFNLKPEVKIDEQGYQLLTTPIFKFLIKNLGKNKKRLAATAQIYLAKGFRQILEKVRKNEKNPIFWAGGVANNKIMSDELAKIGVIKNKILPSGDVSLSFGQIIYYHIQFASATCG